MKLKNRNGQADFIMRAGTDLVGGRIPVEKAQQIIDNGTLVESCIKTHPICVDDKFFFEAEAEAEKTTKPKTTRKRKGP